MTEPLFSRGNIVSIISTQTTGTIFGIFYNDPFSYAITDDQGNSNVYQESELQLIDGTQKFPELYTPKINDTVQFTIDDVNITGTITSINTFTPSCTVKDTQGNVHTVNINLIQPFVG
jgi:hypothetical protein